MTLTRNTSRDAEIRLLRAQGEKLEVIAMEFGISMSRVCQICTGSIGSSAGQGLTVRMSGHQSRAR